jgi:hypothetical protein
MQHTAASGAGVQGLHLDGSGTAATPIQQTAVPAVGSSLLAGDSTHMQLLLGGSSAAQFTMRTGLQLHSLAPRGVSAALHSTYPTASLAEEPYCDSAFGETQLGLAPGMQLAVCPDARDLVLCGNKHAAESTGCAPASVGVSHAGNVYLLQQLSVVR